MTTPTKAEMTALVNQLRAIAPKRPLTYGESLQVARLQASRYRQWAAAIEPEINLIGLVKQRLMPVSFVPSYKLNGESGLTTDAVDGKLQIFVNENEPLVRQRFSLLHEMKHALDFDKAELLHSKLGRGNQKLHDDMIEWLANEFAAHVLMPTALVKRIWFTTQNLSLAASLFNVSTEAMATRLEKLGLIGTPKPAPRIYFRQVGSLPMSPLDVPCLAA
ncbi:ImmA/IrrE family metallo-endopeptidase [Amycolatopsis sp. H20-H5]|uniref:ImmA/IrrE family metallo-endopeptidase n=1 Tax=Amycolatopsis sp. H20-H5 TaxID=3046309 RepID=UPI002DBDB62F|nr:ImmA/IrrE family metallo-endopeptidase [Amycolatopsis sp. H20-H5]MEC3976232.1 ImmA/IrrE family metallo-endopeptidase [Amycolatopsis sp. H20-H5]